VWETKYDTTFRNLWFVIQLFLNSLVDNHAVVSSRHSLFALVLLPSQMLFLILISPSSASDTVCSHWWTILFAWCHTERPDKGYNVLFVYFVWYHFAKELQKEMPLIRSASLWIQVAVYASKNKLANRLSNILEAKNEVCYVKTLVMTLGLQY